MLHLIGYIASGLVAGILTRALNPDSEQITLGKTVALGIVGAIFAGYLGGYLASITGAAFILTIYYYVSRQMDSTHDSSHVL